jgi:GNAT superfamily N-acetyltransferase
MTKEVVTDMPIEIKKTKDIELQQILDLYRSNGWSSGNKPEQLYNALMNSDALISAWDSNRLVGIANAISDGHLVVYYPHMLILPEYQGQGIGTRIMKVLLDKYKNFHQQMLTADGRSIEFYRKCGFSRAGKTEPMWIYDGDEH